MATKEQERKALEQIMKIMESLGEDSYIATAMQGMIEDARENIENDFALSMKDRVEDEKKKLAIREGQLDKMAKELIALRKEKESGLYQLQQAIDQRAELQDRHDQLMKEFDQLRIEKFEAENRAGVAESKIVDLKEEIVHLKAKLYDMLTKED